MKISPVRSTLSTALTLIVLMPNLASASEPASSENPDQQGAPLASGPSEDDPAILGSLQSYRVTGAALRPRETDVTTTVDANGSCSYVAAGDASTVWNTPVQLPQGATVDTLRMYYYDTSASNMTAWFTVYDLYGSIVEEWSVSSNVSAGNSFNDSAQIGHTIDYTTHSYLINWRPIVTGSTLQLCGFRIFYTP